MDQISSIRCKNLVDRLLACCDDSENEEDRAVVMRISVVMLAKLRIHGDVDAMLSYDVRELISAVNICEGRKGLLELWDRTTDLLQLYRDALAQ